MLARIWFWLFHVHTWSYLQKYNIMWHENDGGGVYKSYLLYECCDSKCKKIKKVGA